MSYAGYVIAAYALFALVLAWDFVAPKLQGGGPWVFFCSFPGHAALMKGTVTIR